MLYTKKDDNSFTILFRKGNKVSKSSAIIEALGTIFAALFDIGRTFIRNTERRIVTLEENNFFEINLDIKKYLSRLSTLLFDMSRLTNLRQNAEESHQLKYWKMVKENFTEHNPSVTIYICDKEIYRNKFNELSYNVKNIDFSQIISFEKDDETDIKTELACASGACDL